METSPGVLLKDYVVGKVLDRKNQRDYADNVDLQYNLEAMFHVVYWEKMTLTRVNNFDRIYTPLPACHTNLSSDSGLSKSNGKFY